jgi:cell division protein ZapA
MSDGHSLVIHILDKEYRVACPPGEQDNLLRAARYLDNQMRGSPSWRR